MENKYYIPVIEDIKVGYECTITAPLYEEKTFIVDKNQVQYAALILRANKLATPYLTKEQIDKEEGWHGWTGYGAFEKTDPQYFFSKRLKVDLHDREYALINCMYNFAAKELIVDRDMTRIYIGSCPSINEFRTICKLLNI
jgi:hypothetical protein